MATAFHRSSPSSGTHCGTEAATDGYAGVAATAESTASTTSQPTGPSRSITPADAAISNARRPHDHASTVLRGSRSPSRPASPESATYGRTPMATVSEAQDAEPVRSSA